MSSSTVDDVVKMRNKIWTPELDKLLRRWKCQLGKREKGHLNEARKNNMKHYMLGIPAIIISALVSTGSLSTFEDCSDNENCKTKEAIRLTAGIFGIISTSLMGLSTFLNYQKKEEEHKSSADECGSLYRILDTMLLVPGPIRGDPISTLYNFRRQYDNLIRRSPTLPSKYDVNLSYGVINREKLQNTNLSNISNNNIGSEMTSINEWIEKENDHDTDDEEKEVMLPFDLDSSPCYEPKLAAMAAASLAVKRDEEMNDYIKFLNNNRISKRMEKSQKHQRHLSLDDRETKRRKRTPKVI